jgi:hypothetical protein
MIDRISLHTHIKEKQFFLNLNKYYNARSQESSTKFLTLGAGVLHFFSATREQKLPSRQKRRRLRNRSRATVKVDLSGGRTGGHGTSDVTEDRGMLNMLFRFALLTRKPSVLRRRLTHLREDHALVQN